MELVKSAQRLQLHLIPGKKLCPTCRKKLSAIEASRNDSTEEDSSDEMLFVEESVSCDEDRDQLHDLFSSIGVSPIKVHGKPETARISSSKRKIGSVVETITKKVASSINVPVEQLKSSPDAKSDKALSEKARCFDEMMSCLREKIFSLTSSRAKLQILTLCPSNWTVKQCAEYFKVSEYLVRTARKLANEKGILSLPDPKMGRGLSQVTRDLVLQFYHDEEHTREMPGQKDFDTQVAKKPKILEGKENETEKNNAPGSPARSSSPDSNTCLSPEQKDRMQKNKLKAEIKQASRKFGALHENIGTSWFSALKGEFSKPYFEKLSLFLDGERKKSTIFPPAEQVYSWTHHCELREVKVVILGQDPYHGPRQAHGLCFSVQKGVPPPPSLLNMYKELESDIEGFQRPSHGHLIGWAKQGVLLLNACLTVRAHNANSHKDQGWEKFTDSVIKAVSDRNKGVVFLLWGSYAQKKAAVVDKKKHHLLNTTHPSPLSAHRGFLGCKHFSKCNEILKKEGKRPIDWTYLPLEM